MLRLPRVKGDVEDGRRSDSFTSVSALGGDLTCVISDLISQNPPVSTVTVKIMDVYCLNIVSPDRL